MDSQYQDTLGMPDAEVAERLAATRTGVLSLADADDAYAIPLAHYYDGERLFFRLGLPPESTKRRYLASTDTATYVVYEADPTDEPQGLDSWSIVVTGRLVDLDEADRERFDQATIDRHFPPIRLFGEAVEAVEITMYELEIESLTGRVTPLES